MIDNSDCIIYPPYFKWLAKDDSLPYETAERNVYFYLGHYGFLLFNVLNVTYVVLFEGYALGNLRKNFMLQLATVACFSQSVSCYSSLVRYNINDEHSWWREFGTVTSCCAFSFFGATALGMLVLCLADDTSDCGRTWWRIGSVAWALAAIGTCLYNILNYDPDNFPLFKYFVFASNVLMVISLGVMVYTLRNKNKILVYEGLSNDALVRIYSVLLGLGIVVLLLPGITGAPIFQFPCTGFNFSVLVIASKFAGVLHAQGATAVAENRNEIETDTENENKTGDEPN